MASAHARANSDALYVSLMCEDSSSFFSPIPLISNLIKLIFMIINWFFDSLLLYLIAVVISYIKREFSFIDLFRFFFRKSDFSFFFVFHSDKRKRVWLSRKQFSYKCKTNKYIKKGSCFIKSYFYLNKEYFFYLCNVYLSLFSIRSYDSNDTIKSLEFTTCINLFVRFYKVALRVWFVILCDVSRIRWL